MSSVASKRQRLKAEHVRDFIRIGMVDQGATAKQADDSTMCVYGFGQDNIDNMLRCILSDLPENVVEGIIAHDFNGLSRRDEYFLPKSTQFAKEA